MSTTWVLHTETKGTGANMVPLERVTKHSTAPEPVFAPGKPRPREPEAPQPRAARRFRVVDLMTRQSLADDVHAADAVEALKDVRSVVDVNVFVWQEERERWRLLTFSEKRTMFDMAAAQEHTARAGRPSRAMTTFTWR